MASQQDTDLPPYVIRALRQGTEIEFLGEIDYGTAQDLRQILDANPSAKVLHLNSPGGEISEARKMLRIVRERGLITTTDEFCASACTLVFLAGRERYLAPGAKLGFHRARAIDMSPAEIDSIEQSDRDFMLALRVPSTFVDKVFSTPSNTIWIPTEAELKTAGVITLASPKFLISVDRHAYKPSEDDELFERTLQAVKATDPDRYKRLHQGLFTAMMAGGSEQKLSVVLESELTPLFLKYMSHTSDALAVDYAQTLRVNLAKISTRSPDDCFYALHPDKAPQSFNLARLITTAEFKKMSDITMSAFIDGATRNAPIPSEAELASAALVISQGIQSKYPGEVELLSRADSPNADHAAICKATMDMLTLVLSVPSAQQGPFLRFMFATQAGETTSNPPGTPLQERHDPHPDK